MSLRAIMILLFLCSLRLDAQETVDTLYCDADVTISGAASNELAPGGGRQGYLCVGTFVHDPVNSFNQAYVRFQLNDIDPASVSKAELKLWKSRGRQDTLRVHAVADDGWDEYHLWWLNKPVDGNLLGSVFVSGGQYNSVAVTDFVKAQTDDVASFCLKVEMWSNPNEYIGFNSREGGAPPLLVVTHSGPRRPDPPPAPGFPSTSSLEHGVYIHAGGSYTKYESITQAIGRVQPGQEIVLGPGAYYETFDLTPNGTAQAPLVIRGDGNPRPIIDGSLNSTSWKNTDRGLIKVSGDYWTIEHLEVRNAHPWAEAEANSGGFYIYPGSYCTIRDCGVYFNGDGIFSTASAGNLRLEYNEVAWNSFPGAGYEHGHYLNGFGTTTVRFCDIHDNGGQNFKSRTEDLVFAYNYVHSPGNYQVDMVEGSDFTDQDALLIGNVIVTDNRYHTNEQFVVFGENRRGGSLYLFNNTFIHLYPAGSSFIHLWYPGTTAVSTTTLEAWNNVFYVQPGAGNQLLVGQDKPTPVSGADNWISESISSVPTELAGTINGDDPGLVDIPGGNFRPLETSPLVDAGYGAAAYLPEFQYVHPRKKEARKVAGPAIDIGAYEYSTGAGAFDFHHDGKLNILDVVALVLALFRGETGPAWDVNGDSAFSAADAISLLVVIRDLS